MRQKLSLLPPMTVDLPALSSLLAAVCGDSRNIHQRSEAASSPCPPQSTPGSGPALQPHWSLSPAPQPHWSLRSAVSNTLNKTNPQQSVTKASPGQDGAPACHHWSATAHHGGVARRHHRVPPVRDRPQGGVHLHQGDNPT